MVTQEDAEHYRNIYCCRFCEKNIKVDKVRYHCYLTSKYRGLADSKCNINVTEEESNFVPLVFHNFNNIVCHT